MEPELISKKELLELTGISYGQLYRWKRKDLIPEDWFIRKSTFTGQETFFPKDKILARVEQIKNRKDDLSLDDIADLLSASPSTLILTTEELVERNIVSRNALEHYLKASGHAGPLAFDRVLCAYILERLLKSGDIGLDEGALVVQALEENYGKLEGRDGEFLFLRKLGVGLCCLVTSPGGIHFDRGVKVVRRLALADCVAELKARIDQGGKQDD